MVPEVADLCGSCLKIKLVIISYTTQVNVHLQYQEVHHHKSGVQPCAEIGLYTH